MGQIIVFHGSDSRSGTSMTSAVVAGMLADRFQEGRILLAGMCGGYSNPYYKGRTVGMTGIKANLINRTLQRAPLGQRADCRGNLDVIGGCGNPLEARDFFPDMAEYFLKVMKTEYDYIVCDAGNDLDNGMALGALKYGDYRCMVIPQRERGLAGYEEKCQLYSRLGLSFDTFILNRFLPGDPYDREYVCQRLGIYPDSLRVVSLAGSSRQAEAEHRLLSDYKNDTYRRDIAGLVSALIMDPEAEAMGRKVGLWRRISSF